MPSPRRISPSREPVQPASSSKEQTTWLVEFAKQAHGTGTTRVFVVTEIDQPGVLAYYAWCMASVAITHVPERLRRGAGRYPSPSPCWPAWGWTNAMKARGFYEHLIPEFERSPTDPLHMLLLLKDIRRRLHSLPR